MHTHSCSHLFSVTMSLYNNFLIAATLSLRLVVFVDFPRYFFLQISWGMCLYTAQHSNLTVIFFLIITWRSLQQHSLSALTFSYLTKTRWDRELSLDFQSQLLLLIFRIFLFVVFTLAYGNYEFSLFSSLLCSPACSLILIERDLIVFIFILGCLFYNCWEINFAFNLFTSSFFCW